MSRNKKAQQSQPDTAVDVIVTLQQGGRNPKKHEINITKLIERLRRIRIVEIPRNVTQKDNTTYLTTKTVFLGRGVVVAIMAKTHDIDPTSVIVSYRVREYLEDNTFLEALHRLGFMTRIELRAMCKHIQDERSASFREDQINDALSTLKHYGINVQVLSDSK